MDIPKNGFSIDFQKSPYSPFTDMAQERGKLLEKNFYATNGTTPIQRETYDYSPLNGNKDSIRSVYLRRLALFGSYSANAFEGAAYQIYIYPYNVTKKTEYFYDTNGQTPIVTETSYGYNDLGQLFSTAQKDSRNNTISTATYYPYMSSGFADGSIPDYGDYTFRQGMIAKNLLSYPLQEVIKRGSGVTEMTRYRYGTFNGITKLTKIEKTSLTAPRDGFDPVRDADLTPELYFDNYDKLGNQLQTRTRNNVPTTYIWGYGGSYLVARIENADYNSVKAALGNIDLVNQPLAGPLSAGQESALRNLPNTLVTICTYKPLVGVTSITDPSGRTTHYDYDQYGRLISVLDDQGQPLTGYEYHYKQ